MNARKLFGLVVILVLITLALVSGASAQGPKRAPQQSGSPTVVSYQGHVTVSGSSYNGTGYFKFAVVNQTGNTTYWSNDGTSTGGGAPTSAVPLTVSYGLFNVLLGDTTLTNMTQVLTASVFNGTDRYLRVWFSSSSSGPFTQLSPDQRFASVPYALQAVEAMNAWDVNGNSGTTYGTNFVGTTDNVALTLRVNNVVGWRLAPSGLNTPNVIGGHGGNTVDGGIYGATIGGGGASGLSINHVAGNYSTIGGGVGNIAGGGGAFVGGGGYDGTNLWGNTANGNASTIGGGYGNSITASGTYATIGGGNQNSANYAYATVGGGFGNTASGGGAFVGGGGYDGTNLWGNTANGNASTIGGGYRNSITASGTYATIGGGNQNSASSNYATVGGGNINSASSNYATVSGGNGNTASGAGAFVGGGGYDGMNLWGNTANGNASTIGGGYGNSITAVSPYATIGGGRLNSASSGDATVGGGYQNAASLRATVAGGYNNNASGNYATIPGGYNNTASGGYALAAGYRAKANNHGTFVWADYTEADFASSAENQFLIRASGGVGIGTNNPGDALEVNGIVRVDTLGSGGSTQLCRNGSNQISQCSSSLRYKNNLANLSLGLDTIAQLRPVTFNWKDSGQTDLGFVAEEVNQVTPLLTTLNAQGQIEGVKYDRITAVLVKGIQEQQQQIAELQHQVTNLQSQNAKQQSELDDIKTRLAGLEQNSRATVTFDMNGYLFIALLIGAVVFYRGRR